MSFQRHGEVVHILYTYRRPGHNLYLDCDLMFSILFLC